jgi:hypothetical protein
MRFGLIGMNIKKIITHLKILKGGKDRQKQIMKIWMKMKKIVTEKSLLDILIKYCRRKNMNKEYKKIFDEWVEKNQLENNNAFSSLRILIFDKIERMAAYRDETLPFDKWLCAALHLLWLDLSSSLELEVDDDDKAKEADDLWKEQTTELEEYEY